jgi:signal peptidase II
VEWNWPEWVPKIGGDHFIFFQPVFNVADAALSVSVIVLILFYRRFLAPDDAKEADDDQSTPDDDANSTPA